jgi:hypothetical protein
LLPFCNRPQTRRFRLLSPKILAKRANVDFAAEWHGATKRRNPRRIA